MALPHGARLTDTRIDVRKDGTVVHGGDGNPSWELHARTPRRGKSGRQGGNSPGRWRPFLRRELVRKMSVGVTTSDVPASQSCRTLPRALSGTARGNLPNSLAWRKDRCALHRHAGAARDRDGHRRKALVVTRQACRVCRAGGAGKLLARTGPLDCLACGQVVRAPVDDGREFQAG